MITLQKKLTISFLALMATTGCTINKNELAAQSKDDRYILTEYISFGCVRTFNKDDEETIIQAKAYALAKLAAYQQRKITGKETTQSKKSGNLFTSTYTQEINESNTGQFTLPKIIKQWKTATKQCVQVQIPPTTISAS